MFRLLFNLSIFLSPSAVWAAACCAGGLAAPALVMGDDKAQVTTSYSYLQIQDDVYDNGIWKERSSAESGQVYRFDAATIFSDRWQVGTSIPVVTRTRSEDSSSGFGDVSANLGYEYLPDWDYSLWRPKGLGYLQLTLPTGKSIQESESLYQLDSRGRGFWALGIGSVLTKIIRRWDVALMLEGHRSFDKNYANSQSVGTLHPGFGANWGLGAGYNLDRLRFGGSLTWTFEDPVNVRGTINSEGAVQRYATASLSLTYLFPHDWSSTLSYADQTLFGDPANATLSRLVLLQLQKRFPR